MTSRLTKREGATLRLTRDTNAPSPFAKFDVAAALGASHIIERRISDGNPLARSRIRSLWAGVLLAETELPAEDAVSVNKLLDHMKELLPRVDRPQILRALLHRELVQLRKDPQRIEQEIAEYLTATGGDEKM